eukprot:4331957-Pleurochrysis_carterae.AAC.1
MEVSQRSSECSSMHGNEVGAKNLVLRVIKRPMICIKSENGQKAQCVGIDYATLYPYKLQINLGLVTYLPARAKQIPTYYLPDYR